MTTTENKTLGGRPIRGEISHYGRNPAEQKPIEELLAALDALFAFEEVQSVRWHQHTPYFNDGDACEFGVRGTAVRLEGIAENAGEDGDGYLSAWDLRWDLEHARNYGEARKYAHLSDELVAAIFAALDAIGDSAHETNLRQHFGDPAEVTATRDGFDVEGYEHD